MSIKEITGFSFQAFIASTALSLGSAPAVMAFSVIYNRDPLMKWITVNSFATVFALSFTLSIVSLALIIGTGVIRVRRKWARRKS